MQLYPTRSTFHAAVAGVGLVTLGAAARLPAVVAFGGAMLLAVALGRAVATVKIKRLRAAGFEMVWADGRRVHRTTRGSALKLQAELRNRSDGTVRATGVRALSSSMLDVSITPAVLDLAPGSQARVEVTIQPSRIGRWGIHGLALEVTATPFGTEGLLEIPLLFANPLGIEVFPAGAEVLARLPAGGGMHRTEPSGRRTRSLGDADDLRELRDHVAGDPFKRIAWKASARRGRLLVRELERPEQDVVWLVVDASVDLWAGVPGHAPLDAVADEVSAVAARYLRNGARVGLVVTASRLRAWIDPKSQHGHGAILASALTSMSVMVDADRSELDEAQVAQRVSEHARPFDPNGLADIPRGNLDALGARAEHLRALAPFAPRLPFAPTPREQSLRHYLSSFGIESPPKNHGERTAAETTLGRALDRLRAEKPRPSVVHVWAPPPANVAAMAKRVVVLRRRGTEVRWTLPSLDVALDRAAPGRGPAAGVAIDAVRMRARASGRNGERLLRGIGVRVVPSRARAAEARSGASAGAAEARADANPEAAPPQSSGPTPSPDGTTQDDVAQGSKGAAAPGAIG